MCQLANFDCSPLTRFNESSVVMKIMQPGHQSFSRNNNTGRDSRPAEQQTLQDNSTHTATTCK